MTELTATRIKSHATKLGLPHLAASLEQLVMRADAEQLGYLDFLDLIVEEELVSATAAASGRPCDSRSYRTIRRSMILSSASNLSSTFGRS
jgi:hypothetical protein